MLNFQYLYTLLPSTLNALDNIHSSSPNIPCPSIIFARWTHGLHCYTNVTGDEARPGRYKGWLRVHPHMGCVAVIPMTSDRFRVTPERIRCTVRWSRRWPDDDFELGQWFSRQKDAHQ